MIYRTPDAATPLSWSAGSRSDDCTRKSRTVGIPQCHFYLVRSCVVSPNGPIRLPRGGSSRRSRGFSPQRVTGTKDQAGGTRRRCFAASNSSMFNTGTNASLPRKTGDCSHGRCQDLHEAWAGRPLCAVRNGMTPGITIQAVP